MPPDVLLMPTQKEVIDWKLKSVNLESTKVVDNQIDLVFMYEAMVEGVLVSKEVIDTVDLCEGIIPSDGLGVKPSGSDKWTMLKPETDEKTIIKICNSLKNE